MKGRFFAYRGKISDKNPISLRALFSASVHRSQLQPHGEGVEGVQSPDIYIHHLPPKKLAGSCAWAMPTFSLPSESNRNN
jgi:hypothetical protein